MENEQALALLEKRLLHLQDLNFEDLHAQLALGLLAGNVFDWGAKEVALLLESRKGIQFEDALGFVNPRPWLVDDLDVWKERMRAGIPHKCAAIFIDNSGVDVVLGILPFTEELLRCSLGLQIIIWPETFFYNFVHGLYYIGEGQM